MSKTVSLLLDGVHSAPLPVATAVVGAEGGDSKRLPIFHKAEVTCGGDIKLDYWTATGKKTKLRNVKYPVALCIAGAGVVVCGGDACGCCEGDCVAAGASGSVSLVVSVSLGGNKR